MRHEIQVQTTKTARPADVAPPDLIAMQSRLIARRFRCASPAMTRLIATLAFETRAGR